MAHQLLELKWSTLIHNGGDDYETITNVTLKLPLLRTPHQGTLSLLWVGKLDSGELGIWLHLFSHWDELGKIEGSKRFHHSLTPHTMHGGEGEPQVSVAVF